MRIGYPYRFKLMKSVRDVDRALRQVVRSASANIPVYGDLLKTANVSVDRFRGLTDLPRLPVVQRELLMLDTPLARRITRRVAPARLVSTSTSGSDGMPVRVYMSKTEAMFRKLTLIRAWGRVAPLRLPYTVIDVGARSEPKKTLDLSWHGAIRLIRLPLSDLAKIKPGLLRRYRPAVLGGYPSSLMLLAERLGQVSACPPFPSLQLVASRGEILHEEEREILMRVFRCQVADFYNCEEIGNIAWQCPADPTRLHINLDTCVVEVVDESHAPVPAGADGKILVTSLYNYTMPLIRYDLQDRGHILPPSEEPCSCGSVFASMGLVQGREDDILMLSDGTRASPRWLATLLDESAARIRENDIENSPFRQYEIVQDAPGHITIRIVPTLPEDSRLAHIILSAFQRLDPGMKYSVELVSELPPPPSGKRRKVRRTTLSP